ncbi:MAG: diguanylate cyclase domain-containing protein [Pirellulaceae bacterium]
MPTTIVSATASDWAPKLLYVDDDPNAHDLTDYYLVGVVSKTLHASSGSEGIRIAKESLPDVILLDIEMPGMDGFQVCRQLKEMDATRNIPILFLTRDKQSGHIAKALDYGGSDYVTKPFVPVELQARVRSALRLKRAIDALREQAMFDPLTNLANRRAFDEGLLASLADHMRNGHNFGLLILDLDHFKLINDNYGHGVGDEVLIQVGAVIRHVCRPYDVAARYGGEEFGLILNQTERAEARSIGQRLLDSTRQLAISINDGRLYITASAGLAYTSADRAETDAKQLLGRADAALYEAKRQGRNRMVEQAHN